MVSGGSFASVSLTFAAKTVTVQLSPFAKFESGLSVKDCGPPETAAVCAPEVAHEIVNQLPVTFTSSLKVSETFASTATSVAPFAGVVACTDGGWSTVEPVIETSSTPTH